MNPGIQVIDIYSLSPGSNPRLLDLETGLHVLIVLEQAAVQVATPGY